MFDPETEQYEEIASSDYGVNLTEQYRYRGPVLVDEAHNFRNEVNRTLGLRDYLERGDHKVILLSATPQNLDRATSTARSGCFWTKLTTDYRWNHRVGGLLPQRSPVAGISQAVDAYAAALAEHMKSGSGGTPPTEPQRPSTPPANIAQVLTPIFIRRRRRDIIEIYGDTATINGEPVAFPTPRLSNLEYRLDRVYAKAGNFADLLATMGRHQAVRYNPTEYLKPGQRGNQRYVDIFRARGRIAGMIQHLLFKRLESSIPAFRSTLGSLSHSNRSFKAALQAGYVPVGSVATSLLAGQNFDAEEALAILQLEETKRNGQYQFRPATLTMNAGSRTSTTTTPY